MTVSIRRAVASDLDFLVELTMHAEVDPFLAAGRDRSPQALAAAIERSESTPDDFGVFVIEVDGNPVGTVRFAVFSRHSRIADLSGLAVHPDARGLGVADTAARLLQRHLIDDLGYHRLQLEVYAFNERGLAHAERVGYVREGVRRKAFRDSDGWVDGVLFGLVADER
jgi:RimJ/RimL family protein N-acetyltransferase